MKKKQTKRLVLAKESLQLLEKFLLRKVDGGYPPAPTEWKPRCPNIDSQMVC